MSVNSKLTAIADEIRVLSGTEEAMGLDAMATHVQAANNEIELQSGLLVELEAVLNGKAAGGAESELVSQSKTVIPSTEEQVVLPDSGYTHLSQVTVAAIPYAENENTAGGITVTIG